MSIRALIVDDEPLARHSIARLLRKEAEIVIAGEFSCACAAACDRGLPKNVSATSRVM